jgi:hypothetical protein
MMRLDGRRVLAILALSTSGCLLEAGRHESSSDDGSNCGCPTGNASASPSDFDLTGITEVIVEGSNGTIDFDGNASAPSISWKTRGSVSVTIERNGSTLDVKAHAPSTCTNCGIDYDVHVPSGLDVKLATSNGEIHCGGSVRSITSSTSNGKIIATHLSGVLDLETSNGAVTCDDMAPEGHSKITTSNGAVLITHLVTKVGFTVSGTTSNGDVCVSLNGFQVTKSSDGFDATSCGNETGSLTITTSNASICVSN